MAGTVTAPPHQFLNLPRLRHEVSSSSLGEKEPPDPTYLTYLPPHLHSKCRCEFNPAHPEKVESKHLLPLALHPPAILLKSVGHSSNALWAFELLRSTQRTQWMLLLLFPFLSRFPGDCSSIRTILYTLRLFIAVYQVNIPGVVLPFSSPLSWEGGLQLHFETMLYTLRLFIRVPGLYTLRYPSLSFPPWKGLQLHFESYAICPPVIRTCTRFRYLVMSFPSISKRLYIGAYLDCKIGSQHSDFAVKCSVRGPGICGTQEFS